ncbi:MAG: hypothetical protein ACRDSJ_18905, partial [Rubrobacteraceae bacterium]
IEALGDSMGRIKRGGDAKLELELCFMKLARDYAEPSVESLMSRLEALENGHLAASPTPTRRAEVEKPPPEPDDEPVEEGAPEPAEPEPVASEPASGKPSGGVDLASGWSSVMRELKRRKRALTAAVYADARVEGFDGEVLKLSFPAEQSFQVEMARQRKHTDYLLEVLETKFGVRPRLELDSGSEPVREEVSSEPESSPEPGAQASAESNDEMPGEEMNGPVGSSRAPGAGNDDDIIRDQREAFEMAQARFDLGDDKGS